MPLEVKKIYFTESEVRKALLNFSVLRKQYLDFNDIKKMIVNNTDEIHISLLVDHALEFEGNKLTYSNHEVAAALLAFCMALKIPLPKKGVKELHANKEYIYLKVSYQQVANFDEYKICHSLQNTHYIRN